MSTYSADVMDKIKKLLARAMSSEAHEAALALEMAQRLMAENGLTTEEVEVGRVGAERVRSVASVSKAKGWELALYHGIADAFGCGLMFSRGQRFHPDGSLVTDSEVYAHYLFIAPAAEAQLASYAASVLQRQLINAKGKFLRSLPEAWNRVQKSGEVDAYCRGWVTSALSKVSKLVFSEARKRAIAKYVAETSGGGKVGVKERSGSLESATRGLRDGRDTELNRPVEKGQETRGLNAGRLALKA